MAEFNPRADTVNVEQIMEQIRARIRDKRGVDYTEQQVQELAKARLEHVLEPRALQADLLDQFKKLQPAYRPPELPAYEFEDSTLFDSHRGALRTIRRLLQPILKLFFNPNPLIQALHIQARLNAMYAEREAKREAMRLATEQLYFERLHALVVETTRATLELKSLRMRVESMSGRLEFNERRARAIESAVVYKPSGDESSARGPRQQQTPHRPAEAVALRSDPAPARAVPFSPEPMQAAAPQAQPASEHGEGSGQRRRRRRRRGRRGGGAQLPGPGTPPPGDAQAPEQDVAVAKDDLDTVSGSSMHPSETDGVVEREPASRTPEPEAAVAAQPEAMADPAPEPPHSAPPSDDTQ